jgi:DNA-binding NtrC family response regulator
MEGMEASAARILVVDDDPAIRKIIVDRFRSLGHELVPAGSGEEALERIESFAPDLMLLDLRMPGIDGFQVLESLRARAARPEVVVMTAHGSIEAAVRAVRLGAADFVPKPFEAPHLEHVVARVLETAVLRRRVERLELELSARHALVVGESAAMADVVATARRAAGSQSTILLLGESGSGKEVLARFIHRESPRHGAPFVAVNCAVLSAELLESELFGHEKGAFTGAFQAKPGRLELAAGGTLFLDEIGDLAPSLQAKLLRVIQEREFERVGGTRTLRADVRLVAATHRDLARAVEEGRFRQDLYYRLNVVCLRIPPLRERPGDLPALIDHFCRRLSAEAGRPPLSFDAPTRALLLRYPWPGNVREISNVIERAVVLAGGPVIGLEELPEELREWGAQEQEEAGTGPSAPEVAVVPAPVLSSGKLPSFHAAVREAKRRLIGEALERTGGHQTRAAELLGLTQPYLSRLMKSLRIKKG